VRTGQSMKGRSRPGRAGETRAARVETALGESASTSSGPWVPSLPRSHGGRHPRTRKDDVLTVPRPSWNRTWRTRGRSRASALGRPRRPAGMARRTGLGDSRARGGQPRPLGHGRRRADGSGVGSLGCPAGCHEPGRLLIARAGQTLFAPGRDMTHWDTPARPTVHHRLAAVPQRPGSRPEDPPRRRDEAGRDATIQTRGGGTHASPSVRTNGTLWSTNVHASGSMEEEVVGP
jgi:hypothetical protein